MQGNLPMRLFLLACLLAAVNRATAQDEINSFKFSAGPALAFVSARDETFSKLRYNGTAIGGNATVSFSKRGSTHYIYTDFHSGNLENSEGKRFDAFYKYFNAGYSYLRTIGPDKTEHLSWKAGVGADFLYSRREYQQLINNYRGYEYAMGLNALIECFISFRHNNGNTILSNSVQLPVAAAVAQPVYGADAWDVPSSEGNDLKEAANNFKLLTVPAFIRFKNRLLAVREFSTHHSISFSYLADYINIRDKRNSRLMVHQIALHYGFSF